MRIWFVQEKNNGRWSNVKKRSLMRSYESKREAKKDICSYLRRHQDETESDYRVLALTVA